LSRIHGIERQVIARRLYAEHGFTALSEFLVKEGLNNEERDAWGAIGPWCMGGEYLPEVKEGEMEIARISMRSVMSDQISVRATRVPDGIEYRIVGEYEEDESWRCRLPFDTSKEPLSLGELMDLMQRSNQAGSGYPGGLFAASWAMMRDHYYDEADTIAFLSLSSPFYPGIQECYVDLAEKWLASEEN